ncbi:hypothetical protein D3C85_1234560 [compost metagenome]
MVVHNLLLSDNRRNGFKRRVGKITLHVADEDRLHRVQHRQQRDIDLKYTLFLSLKLRELLGILGHRDLVSDPVVEQQHLVQLVHMRHADIVPVQNPRAFPVDDAGGLVRGFGIKNLLQLHLVISLLYFTQLIFCGGLPMKKVMESRRGSLELEER